MSGNQFFNPQQLPQKKRHQRLKPIKTQSPQTQDNGKILTEDKDTSSHSSKKLDGFINQPRSLWPSWSVGDISHAHAHLQVNSQPTVNKKPIIKNTQKPRFSRESQVPVWSWTKDDLPVYGEHIQKIKLPKIGKKLKEENIDN